MNRQLNGIFTLIHIEQQARKGNETYAAFCNSSKRKILNAANLCTIQRPGKRGIQREAFI